MSRQSSKVDMLRVSQWDIKFFSWGKHFLLLGEHLGVFDNIKDGQLFIHVSVRGKGLNIRLIELEIASAKSVDDVGDFVEDEKLGSVVVHIAEKASFMCRSLELGRGS